MESNTFYDIYLEELKNLPQGTPEETCRVYAQNGEFLILGEVKDGVLHTIKSFFEV